MTGKMRDALQRVCYADLTTKHKTANVQARTAKALEALGYVEINGRTYEDGNMLECYLPERGVRCESCGRMYDEYGDGYDGECPACADRRYEEEVNL
jgi:hypothetical protein